MFESLFCCLSAECPANEFSKSDMLRVILQTGNKIALTTYLWLLSFLTFPNHPYFVAFFCQETLQFDVRGHSIFFGLQLHVSNQSNQVLHYRLEGQPAKISSSEGFTFSTTNLFTQCHIAMAPNKNRFILLTQLANRLNLCLYGQGILEATQFEDKHVLGKQMLPCKNILLLLEQEWVCLDSFIHQLDLSFVFLQNRTLLQQFVLPQQLSWVHAHSLCLKINGSFPIFTSREHFHRLLFSINSFHFWRTMIQAFFIGLYWNAQVRSEENTTQR